MLDYNDRYTGKTALPQQAIDKLLMPFVPQLLTAQEPVSNTLKKKVGAALGGEEVLAKTAAGDMKKIAATGDEKNNIKNGDVTAEAGGAKSEGIKDNKEAFFDPLGITSASEVRLLEALGERRMQLEARDAAINKRELELQLFEKKLQEKMDTLNTIQEEVKRQLGQLDKGEIAKEQSLSKVYENMKPKDAARVFDLLNISVVMKIIVHMKEKKLSEIMGFVSTERARDITQELAFQSKSLAKPPPKT